MVAQCWVIGKERVQASCKPIDMRTAVRFCMLACSAIHSMFKKGLGTSSVLHETVQWWVNAINARQEDTAGAIYCHWYSMHGEYVCSAVMQVQHFVCKNCNQIGSLTGKCVFHLYWTPGEAEDSAEWVPQIHNSDQQPISLVIVVCRLWIHSLTWNWNGKVLTSTSWWHHDLVGAFWK